MTIDVCYYKIQSIFHTITEGILGINIDMSQEAPRFEIAKRRMRSDLPEITVHFANGMSERLVLENYRGYSSPCNYVGNLEITRANVAVTGCLEKPGDKMEITLLSQNSPKHHMFSVDFDGKASVIENPFKNGGLDKHILNK